MDKKSYQQDVLKQKAKLGKLSSEEILAMQDDLVADVLLDQMHKSSATAAAEEGVDAADGLHGMLDDFAPNSSILDKAPEVAPFVLDAEAPPSVPVVEDDLVINHDIAEAKRKYNPLSYAHSVALVTPFSMFDIAQLAESLSTVASVALAQAKEMEKNPNRNAWRAGDKPVSYRALQVAIDETWAKLANAIVSASDSYIQNIQDVVTDAWSPSSTSSSTTLPMMPRKPRKTGLDYNPLAPSSLSTLSPSSLAELTLAASLSAPKKHAERILHALATAFTYSDRDFWRRANGTAALPYQRALLENFTPTGEMNDGGSAAHSTHSPSTMTNVFSSARKQDEDAFLRDATASHPLPEGELPEEVIPSFDEEPTWQDSEAEARRRARTFYKAPSVPAFRLRGERTDGPPVPVFRLPGETPGYEGLSVTPGDLPKLAGDTLSNWTARVMHRISMPDLAKLAFAYSLAFPSVTPDTASESRDEAFGSTDNWTGNSATPSSDSSFSMVDIGSSVTTIRSALQRFQRSLSDAQVELLPPTWTLPGGPFYGSRTPLATDEAVERFTHVLKEAGVEGLYETDNLRNSVKNANRMRLANGLPSFQHAPTTPAFKRSSTSKHNDGASDRGMGTLEGTFASGHMLGQLCSKLAQRQELPLLKVAPLLQFLATRDYSVLFHAGKQPSASHNNNTNNQGDNVHTLLHTGYSFTALPHAPLVSVLAEKVQSELRKAQTLTKLDHQRRKGLRKSNNASASEEQHLPRPSKLRLPFLALNNYIMGFGSSLDGILAQLNLPGVILESEKQSNDSFSHSEANGTSSSSTAPRLGLNHVFERQKDTYDVLLLLLDEASRRMGTYQAAQQPVDRTSRKTAPIDPVQAVHVLQFGATVAASVIPLVLNPLEVTRQLATKEMIESGSASANANASVEDVVNENLLPGLVLGDPKAWAIATLGYNRASNAIRQEQKRIHRGFVDQEYDKGLALEMKRLEAAKKHAQLVRASGLFVAAMSNFIESDSWKQSLESNPTLLRNPLRKQQLVEAERAISEAAELLKKAFK